MQLLQDALRALVLLQFEPQTTELELRLEPQPVVLGLDQCVQSGAIKFLHNVYTMPEGPYARRQSDSEVTSIDKVESPAALS